VAVVKRRRRVPVFQRPRIPSRRRIEKRTCHDSWIE
jgi:hypothetical protein